MGIGPQEGGTFGREFGALHCNQYARMCATAPRHGPLPKLLWANLLLLGRVALVAQCMIIKLPGRYVGLCVGLSVRRSVQCIVEKRRIGSRCTGPGMRQAVGFGDRSTGRGTFGGEVGARHCNQWGLYGVRVQQRRDAALFPN